MEAIEKLNEIERLIRHQLEPDFSSDEKIENFLQMMRDVHDGNIYNQYAYDSGVLIAEVQILYRTIKEIDTIIKSK